MSQALTDVALEVNAQPPQLEQDDAAGDDMSADMWRAVSLGLRIR